MSNEVSPPVSARASKAEPAAKVQAPLARFEHPGKRVFVLVPQDDNERRAILDHLEPEMLELVEKGIPQPKITTELRLGLTGENKVLYVVITKYKKVVENRKIRLEPSIVVSAPIDCGDYVKESDEDGLEQVDVPTLTDAIQKEAFPFVARLSGDAKLHDKKVKLFST